MADEDDLHFSGSRPKLSDRFGGLWAEWKSQNALLRSALALNRPDSHLQELLQGGLALYKLSIDESSSTPTVLATVSGQNLPHLEAAFMWMGGWRPTSVIVLVYSKMGIKIRQLTPMSPTREAPTAECAIGCTACRYGEFTGSDSEGRGRYIRRAIHVSDADSRSSSDKCGSEGGVL